ncbi:hypothetical protein FQN49_003109 [Arthroderma sp. PD_2]|nr:hypothetical protein FQN49_003109 [Arthroderma sp. PD_2]
MELARTIVKQFSTSGESTRENDDCTSSDGLQSTLDATRQERDEQKRKIAELEARIEYLDKEVDRNFVKYARIRMESSNLACDKAHARIQNVLFQTAGVFFPRDTEDTLDSPENKRLITLLREFVWYLSDHQQINANIPEKYRTGLAWLPSSRNPYKAASLNDFATLLSMPYMSDLRDFWQQDFLTIFKQTVEEVAEEAARRKRRR